MSMILAQSFMKQLKRLTEREQGMVSNTILGLQFDPTAPKFNLHKVDGNAGWWSCYVNDDLRIIFKRNQPQKGEEKHMIICWADHHDAAYVWARNHVLKQHPTTGAMQLVEIPEISDVGGVGHIALSRNESGVSGAPAMRVDRSARPECSPCEKLGITADDLLSFGVPELWISPVLNAKTEDDLLEVG